jgi:hypothetical protein
MILQPLRSTDLNYLSLFLSVILEQLVVLTDTLTTIPLCINDSIYLK